MGTAGHEPPVEVAIQFELPRSRPPPLNGRFPASNLPVALPQPGGGFNRSRFATKPSRDNGQLSRHEGFPACREWWEG